LKITLIYCAGGKEKFKIFPEYLNSIKKTSEKDHKSKPAVKVNDIIGKALPKIGAYKKLDNKKQVVALIDDVGIFLLKPKLKLLIFNCRIYASIVENAT
jgi:hypothetical protein